MKKINILPIIMLLGMVTLFSCEDDKLNPVFDGEVTPSAITAPGTGTNLVLSKAQALETVTFTWSAADYGLQLPANYILQIDKAAGDFSAPVDVFKTADLAKELTFAEFNSKLIALELIPEVVSPIKMRIKSVVENTPVTPVYSPVISLNVTPYEAKDNLWLVGQHNGWNPATAPVMNRNLPGLKYELYLNMPAVDQGFKILPTFNSWAGDIGEDPANPGKLISDGERDMKVSSPGYWKINVDLQFMTWTSLKTHWGLIGSATPGVWDYDTDMTYNAGTGKWELTVDLIAGLIKFRANDGWDLNYGDTGADGKLEQGGDNIAIASAGIYTITLNLNPTGTPQAYTYTVVKN